MEYLTMTKESHAAFIQLARPPANALSTGVIGELDQLMDDLMEDDDVRSILLYGEGRFFSAGADIKEFTEVQSGEEFSVLASNGQRVFEKLENFPKPIVAAIHGAALGGGLELAMACHIRLVSEEAKLGLPELQLGLVPGFAGTQRLPRYVGAAKAAEMLFTSTPLSGKEAVLWGLANQSYPEADLLNKAKEMVLTIAKKSPASLQAVIELLQFGKGRRFYEGVEREAKMFGDVFTTKDGQEGIRAFIEKRAPSFKGE